MEITDLIVFPVQCETLVTCFPVYVIICVGWLSRTFDWAGSLFGGGVTRVGLLLWRA